MTRASRRAAPRAPQSPSPPASRPAEAPERPAWRDRPGVVTVVPAVVALAAGLWDLGGPPPWRDEAATVSAAGRSLPQLAHLLQSVDAVHGLYYALAHVVANLSGTAEVALRMPSVVAGALAAAGTGALGRALGSSRAGLYGGVLLALMPIFSRYVQEARPYAMTAAAAVGVTLLFVRLRRSPTSGVLAAYAAALTVLAYLNLFAFLVAGAHGVTLILSRGPLLRWACAATPALAAVAPLAWLGSRQSAQVGWISRPEAADVGRLAVQLSGDLGGATGPGVAPCVGIRPD
ncbi:glycosyltransferase family 39 protein [Microbispora sp. NPDC049633]|uniref:glycosyltransferase family 39 protein n=1 Tax=Microbispora sp. NPDC049633 TaxID=3154355 RepID=UPI003447F83A